LGPSRPDLRYVVREDPLQEALGVPSPRLDLPHVGDVEQSGMSAHRQVLLSDPLVLHRHLPSGERNEPPPGGPMALKKGRMTKRVGGDGQARQTLQPPMPDAAESQRDQQQRNSGGWRRWRSGPPTVPGRRVRAPSETG